MTLSIWLVLFFIFSSITLHISIASIRAKVFASITHTSNLEYCFINEKKRTRFNFIPYKSTYKAEIIFTEKGIYIFPYWGHADGFKFYYQYFCLFYQREAILPFLQKQVQLVHRIFVIDFIKINGRNVTIEFQKYFERWFIESRELTLNNIRHPDAYRNLLLFHRGWVQQSQQEKGSQ